LYGLSSGHEDLQDVLHGDSAASKEMSALPSLSESLVYGYIPSGVLGVFCLPAYGCDVVCFRQRF
jgi:hypothetical protein